ncbi:hypothetical protein ACIA5D_05220 [Actinoplanes sp. NPDC051513]|uniref:hypothetical protein n=1 Tax=Actinoplanes sp. NPDC051513 TaxID=3363908 RepID=UPI0037BC98B2
MAQWAVIIPADQWATERLYHNETVTVAFAGGAVAPDEEVLLVADDHVVALARAGKTAHDPVVALARAGKTAHDPVVALARAGKTAHDPAGRRGDDLVLTYVRRAFDDPVPAASLAAVLAAGDGPVQVEAQEFRRLTAALAGEPGPGTPTWLVSLALPIEAATPADAVRQFWTHVAVLGPKELPTYVWPSGDELAMQAFVLGEEANQDPEEEDDD